LTDEQKAAEQAKLDELNRLKKLKQDEDKRRKKQMLEDAIAKKQAERKKA
jgi:hypothetical protein